VLSGLSAGDRVVVDNLLKVRPGAAVTEKAPVAAAVPGPTSKPPVADKSVPAAK